MTQNPFWIHLAACHGKTTAQKTGHKPTATTPSQPISIARFALDAVDEITTDAPRKLRTAAYGIIEIENGHSKLTAWDIRAD